MHNLVSFKVSIFPRVTNKSPYIVGTFLERRLMFFLRILLYEYSLAARFPFWALLFLYICSEDQNLALLNGQTTPLLSEMDDLDYLNREIERFRKLGTWVKWKTERKCVDNPNYRCRYILFLILSWWQQTDNSSKIRNGREDSEHKQQHKPHHQSVEGSKP